MGTPNWVPGTSNSSLRGQIEFAQYTSLVFTRRCRAVGIEVSMGSRGDCFDNSPHESFHASLKKDLIRRRSWPTKAEARTAVFEYIEAFYNRRRRHSRLAMLSPVDFENSTLAHDGASLAASRLASTNQIMFTAHQRPRPPSNPVSTEPGEVHPSYGLTMPLRRAAVGAGSVRASG